MKKVNQPFIGLAGIAVATLLCSVASPCQAHTMTWENNNFDTGPGNWLLVQENAADSVGWQNSHNAGGTAGELGGTFTRNTSLAYFGRGLGIDVSLNDELWAKGKFSVTQSPSFSLPDIFPNNSVYLGYFNTSMSPSLDNDYIGWRTREPTNNQDPNGEFRSRARIAVASNITTDQNLVQGVSYAFDIHWIPSGNGDGTGTYTGYVGNVPFSVSYTTAMGPMDMNAFGLWWAESGNETREFNAYFDNLEYLVPVPEPSTPLLVALGGTALWLTRRVRSVRQK